MPRLLPALMLLSVLAWPAQSVRAESEVYGGLGLGYSTFKIDDLSFEGSAYATRQFLGLRYGDYVGVELGYTNFGTVKDRVAVQQDQPSLVDRVETSGYDLALLGVYPIDSGLKVFGKLGAIRWDSEATLGSFPLPTKEDGTDLLWGVGLDFRGSERFHVRIEGEFVDIAFANSWWVLTTSLIYGIPFGR